jgi:hypothetical protein
MAKLKNMFSVKVKQQIPVMLIGFPLAWDFLNMQPGGRARCTVKKKMVAQV